MRISIFSWKTWLLPILLCIGIAAHAEEMLYVVHSIDAQVVLVKPNQYQLILHPNFGHLTYFTDRPVRKTGHVVVSDFLKSWYNRADKDNFKVDHPNASFTALWNGNVFDSFIVIHHPRYDEKTNALSFYIERVNGSTPSAKSMTNATLFIE